MIRRMMFLGFLGVLFSLSLVARTESAGRLPSSELLLPHFEVDLDIPGGLTTFFYVGNADDDPVEIRIMLRSNWGLDILEIGDPMLLQAREVMSFNLADLIGSDEHVQAALTGYRSPMSDNYYSTEVDPLTRRAVGSVVIRALGRAPDVLWGDYFIVDPSEDFAQGELLADLDPVLEANSGDDDDLCGTHAVRFLQGGFDAGTEFMIWNPTSGGPTDIPVYPGTPVVAQITAFGEDGSVIAAFPLDLMPLQLVSISDMGLSEPFGWLRVDTSPVETIVHVRHRALGRYSVGMEAFCLPGETPPAMLTLVKHVINDDGGTKTVGDFPLFVDSRQVTSGVLLEFPPGTYTASEENQTGYTAGPWGGDCAADGTVTLVAGDDKVCEIINDDNPASPPARLKLIKHVINDDGGTARVSDFDLFVGSQRVTSGVFVEFSPGTYTASEHNLPGYTAGPWSGHCAPDGKVTLAAGQNKVCEITNDDNAPPPPDATLMLIKYVINDDGGTLGPDDFPLFANGQPMVSGVAAVLPPGTYTAREESQPGYTAQPWGGHCAPDGTVTLASGENKVCVIANNDLAVSETGRMTGGGSVFMAGTRYTHGFELHCSTRKPNNLKIKWGKGNKFHLTQLESALCLDAPVIDEGRPVAGFDTFQGQGRGLLNGAPGAAIRFTFTDAGEPGKGDLAEFTIVPSTPGPDVAVSGYLKTGNHQARK